MDDTNVYYKQQTYLNTCSDADDSTSFPSFPWFPENNRRRKSRLGTHRNQVRRVFQGPTSNDGELTSSNKENIYDRFSMNKSPPDSAPLETQTEELKPILNYDAETSPFSFTKRKFHNQTSPVLSIPQVFDDEISPLTTSFEKTKTVASSFPSFLADDELDGILREINSDNVQTPRFPLSPGSNRTRTSALKLEKSLDNSVIANQCQTTETKMNKSFSGELPKDVLSVPAVEHRNCTPREHVTNCGPIAEHDSSRTNTIDERNLPNRSSNSANSTECSTSSVSQSVTESIQMNSSSAIINFDTKNSMESYNFTPMPIAENCGLNWTNSIEPTSNALLPRNQFSEPAQLPHRPTDLSSMQDQENVNFQTANENSMFPLDLSPMHYPENYDDFQNPNFKLLLDQPSMQNLNFQNLDESIPKLPTDLSSTRDQEKANFQNSVESYSNVPPKEKINEVDGVLSSTDLKTESMSISSVAEIPSTVKLQKESIPVSGVDKISCSSVDSNLKQNEAFAREPEALPNAVSVVPPPEPPKSSVQFAEAVVVREFAVPRNSSKIPAAITVKGKSYKVLNTLGSGGSSVVFQVSDPETNELLALKKVELPDEDDEITDGYLNEVQMLENLQNCEVIIKIFDHQLVYKNGKKTLHVLMEKGDTDLSSLIKSVNESKKLSIPMIIYYWTEMLAAVNEVHRKGIIHSDLKPANFVLVRGRLKLIDFGIASSIPSDVTSVFKDCFCGTLNYMSPEAISCVRCPSGGAGYKITYKTDVWSLGCILYNLVYGKLPFHHIRKRMEKIQAIISPTMNVEFPEKKDVPPILISLLKSCLEKDYKQRPTVQELLDRTMRIFQCSSVD